MKYVLKDDKKQKVFEKYLPHFAETLDQACKRELVSDIDWLTLETILVQFNDQYCEWSIRIGKHQIKQTQEYDPNNWNNFPETMPPQSVLMRVECGSIKTCLFFKKGKWYYPGGECFENYRCISRQMRYRPWD